MGVWIALDGRSAELEQKQLDLDKKDVYPSYTLHLGRGVITTLLY